MPGSEPAGISISPFFRTQAYTARPPRSTSKPTIVPNFSYPTSLGKPQATATASALLLLEDVTATTGFSNNEASSLGNKDLKVPYAEQGLFAGTAAQVSVPELSRLKHRHLADIPSTQSRSKRISLVRHHPGQSLDIRTLVSQPPFDTWKKTPDSHQADIYDTKRPSTSHLGAFPKMLVTGGTQTDTFVDSGSSAMTSNHSHSDYDLSVNDNERNRHSMSGSKGGKAEKPRWFNQVKGWLSVSEPSAQAMKDQKKMAFKKHGIDPKDPRAAAKMHLPIGKLPEGAITSTRGPSPEKALKRAQNQKKRQSYSTFSQGSNSMSSSICSIPSTKEHNLVAPWET
ncbi:hypothetical protein AK830_g7081 [Neonectria ditissima]|uniref:Uncharacterized protein n=1 Tax=Neonectria ditissima TaxID=78410 RepID=A0A0P7B0H9_9HYPO|nr:hypothetical protein AK830_g7081 [Neonectria ditissima]